MDVVAAVVVVLVVVTGGPVVVLSAVVVVVAIVVVDVGGREAGSGAADGETDEHAAASTARAINRDDLARMGGGYRCCADVVVGRMLGAVEFDGKKQRNALTAAENAVRALADANLSRATANATRAAELDQIGVYADFATTVGRIAGELADSTPNDEQWDAIAATLEPGPLAFLVEELRR